MLNTVYRLVEPRRIEAEFCDLDLNNDNIIIRPTYLSICNADMRYFLGARSADVLRRKLPMALIHEAIGKVVYDPLKQFAAGDRVVMVPNTPFDEDSIIAENYRKTSKFRSSGYDGFMQDIVSLRRDRAVPVPDGIPDNVASFTELVSVSYHTIDRLIDKAHMRKERIGIWGDGNLAFITALLLKKRLPTSKIYIFGKHDYKMQNFIFADQTFSIDEIPSSMEIDHGFECVGRSGASASINQIIDVINPEGCIAAMGVSEENVPINTRMILEKGLTIFGSSRSGVKDFINLFELYSHNPEIVEYMSKIVGEVVDVTTIDDMIKAFDIDAQKKGGKTIMHWMK